VWAADEGRSSACQHGVWIDPRYAARSEALLDELTLLLRDAERDGQDAASVFGEPVTVTLTLSKASVSARDERAQQFLDEHAWLGASLELHVDRLRSTVRRAAAQSDRSASVAAGLEKSAPGDLVPYGDLFPADWDLLIQHGGHTYWAMDLHCPNPACTCVEIVVNFENVDARETRLVGEARLALDARRPKDPRCSTPLAAELFEKLWARRRDELERRRAEVRAAVLRHAKRRPVTAAVEGTPPTIARGAPCPCGSGKKYKRCCAPLTASD